MANAKTAAKVGLALEVAIISSVSSVLPSHLGNGEQQQFSMSQASQHVYLRSDTYGIADLSAIVGTLGLISEGGHARYKKVRKLSCRSIPLCC